MAEFDLRQCWRFAGRVLSRHWLDSRLSSHRGYERRIGGKSINVGLDIGCRQCLCSLLAGTLPHANPSRIHLARGSRLETCRSGCLTIWTVVRGTAGLCALLPDGRRQITSIEIPGDMICGSMCETETHGWLEALEECEICELDLSPISARLRDNPAFLQAMFRVSHRRLMAASRNLVMLGRLDSTERVLLFLMDTAQRKGDGVYRGSAVRLPMSREDIADYLGLNTETVIRILGRLKKTGLVRFLSPTEYLIPNLAAIERRLPLAATAGGLTGSKEANGNWS